VGGTVIGAFAQGFVSLFLSRMLIGFGLFCAIPTAISLAADLSPRAYRGRAIFPLLIGDVLGAAAAFTLGSAALDALSKSSMVHSMALSPWRAVHLIFGAAALVMSLVLLAVLREPVRSERNTRSPMQLLEAVAGLWARRKLLIPLCIGQLGVVMADTAAGIWSAPLLARSYRLNIHQVGDSMGLVLLSTGLIGAVVGGIMADSGQNSQHRFGVMMGAVVASAVALPTSFFAIMPASRGFILMLAVLLLAGSAASIVTSTVIASVIPNELRGATLSLFGALNGLAGFGIAPVWVPAMAGLTGRGNGLSVALAAVTALVNAASFLGFALAAIRLGRSRDHLAQAP
jgi:MFS family permease